MAGRHSLVNVWETLLISTLINIVMREGIPQKDFSFLCYIVQPLKTMHAVRGRRPLYILLHPTRTHIVQAGV